MKRKKREPLFILLVSVLLMLGVTIFTVWYLLRGGSFTSISVSDRIGILLIVGFFILLTFLLFRSFRTGIRKMERLTDALYHATDYIKKQHATSPDTVLQQIITKESLFGNRYLDELFDNYIGEMQQLKSGVCDVEDFISEDSLGSYYYMRQMELVPGVMTGLGILGTFVGLIVGLFQFDISNETAITSSVSGMMNGIKTAFFTSIYGIVYSLAFNYYYKSCQKDLDVALDEFYSEFHRHVVPYSEYRINDQMLQSQKMQKEFISNFAKEVSDTIAKSVQDAVKPVVDITRTSIDHSFEKMYAYQQDGLEKIVDRFLQRMDEEVGNYLKNLGNKTIELCTWEDKMMKKMDLIMQQTYASSQEMQKLLKSMEQFVPLMERNINSLDQYTLSTNQSVDQMNQLLASMTDSYSILRKYAAYQKKFEASMKSLTETIVDTAKQADDNLRSSVDIVNSSWDAGHAALSETSAQEQDRLRQLTNDMNEAYKQTMNVLQNSAEQERVRFDRVANDMKKVTASLNRYLLQIENTADRMTLTRTMEMQRNLAEEWSKQMQDAMDEIMEHMSELTQDNLTALTTTAAFHNKEFENFMNSYAQKRFGSKLLGGFRKNSDD